MWQAEKVCIKKPENLNLFKIWKVFNGIQFGTLGNKRGKFYWDTSGQGTYCHIFRHCRSLPLCRRPEKSTFNGTKTVHIRCRRALLGISFVSSQQTSIIYRLFLSLTWPIFGSFTNTRIFPFHAVCPMAYVSILFFHPFPFFIFQIFLFIIFTSHCSNTSYYIEMCFWNVLFATKTNGFRYSNISLLKKQGFYFRIPIVSGWQRAKHRQRRVFEKPNVFKFVKLVANLFILLIAIVYR